jgi:hypothetical protein
MAMISDIRERAGDQLPNVLLKIILVYISVYLFLCGFVLATCVFMSNADDSPEVSLNFGQHPIRSIMLLVLVAVPLLLMIRFGLGGARVWLCLRLFAGAVAAIGVYAILTPNGMLQAFTADGSIRFGTGIVYAISSVIVLLLSAIPGLRQRLAAGF